MRRRKVLATGLTFPECPRWYDDRLWLSDIFAKQVLTVDLEGNLEVVATFSDRPAGLGFLPDGTPLVALMTTKCVVRVDTGEVYADLSGYGGEYVNDMVVSSQGRVYVGFSARPRSEHDRAGENGDAIFAIELDASVRIAARGGLHMPNGMVLTPDETELIAAMPPLHQVHSFDVLADGRLDGQRVFADLAPEGVDGMCLDASGAVWIASPRTHRFSRVARGGAVLDSIHTGEKWAVACMLGGPARNLLFMMTTMVPPNPVTGMQGNMQLARGSVEVVDVDVAGAGRP